MSALCSSSASRRVRPCLPEFVTQVTSEIKTFYEEGFALMNVTEAKHPVLKEWNKMPKEKLRDKFDPFSNRVALRVGVQDASAFIVSLDFDLFVKETGGLPGDGQVVEAVFGTTGEQGRAFYVVDGGQPQRVGEHCDVCSVGGGGEAGGGSTEVRDSPLGTVGGGGQSGASSDADDRQKDEGVGSGACVLDG